MAIPTSELDARLTRVRAVMAERNLDGLVVASPENIYYLTGLDHWGYFACHVLVVPRDGGLIVCARAMERITFENQVFNAKFYGHADHEELSGYVTRALTDLGLSDGRIGIEKRSLFLTLHHAEGILAGSPGAAWEDASDLIANIRLVKSTLEQEFIRKAAVAADAGTMACIDAIGDGARDYDVAAACHKAMFEAESDYPGFGPFIRPTRRFGEEHTTWCGDTFHDGEAVLLEVGGAYKKYQAPMGRMIYIGSAPKAAEEAAELAMAGMRNVVAALNPGVTAGEIYEVWQDVARSGGLADYRRHHCGYHVGIGFPPSWTGGSMVTSLAPDSPQVLAAGMTFHVQSWFTNTSRGEDFSYFVSNTVLLTENGGEILTSTTPEALQVR